MNALGPLFINEVLAVNSIGAKDSQGHFEDWIEIYNASSRAVNLAGMFLTDDLSVPTKWQFPTGIAARTTVLANRFLLIWADGDTSASGLHAGFSLESEGEEVGLFDANGMRIDAILFGPQTANVSFGRSPDGGGDLRFLGYPSPGAKNGTAYLGEVDAPLFSRYRGFYDGKFTLTLACPTPGATILYTTDGVDPLVSRTAKTYGLPVSIDKTTCVRAAATLQGWRPSQVVTHTYVLGASAATRSLPMISLVASAGQTFYEPNGVAAIVGGTYNGGVWQSSGTGSYNNILDRELERPVSFEWIRPADNDGFQVDCGLRVHGSEYMRPRYTKGSKFSFRLYFRSEYGPAPLEYPLFPFEIEAFDDIVLRAGHNDISNPFIKDELVRRLLKDMGHVSSGGTFANLFINGQSKGYYNPCEHIDEYFCQEWFDSNQPWDVVTMFGNVREGDAIRWNAFINFVREHNLADSAFYAQVLSQLDIVEFVDYLILRLWAADWDWPQNNWAAASERSTQGKWRFFVWDAEGTMESGYLGTVRFNELNTQSNENSVLYKALKVNPSFRQLFGDRVYKHLSQGGALSVENVRRRFQELKDQMAGVLPNMNRYIYDTWAPQRAEVFLNACIQEGVYTFTGPTPSINGKPQYGGYVQPGNSLAFVTEEPNGWIYYTLDGVDPAERLSAAGFGRIDLVTRGSAKRILVPTGPVDIGWRGSGSFNDASWRAGSGSPGGVGFGRDFMLHTSTNVMAAMNGVNASCLVRIPFVLSVDPKVITSLTLKIQSDAGFVAYLNGVEISRYNVMGEPSWNSTATRESSNAVAIAFRSYDISTLSGSLHTGQNVLAIHGMNSSTTEGDFLINAELAADAMAASPPSGLIHYTGPVPLDHSVTVKSRVARENLLSALNEATFSVGPVAQTLRISEIMYHSQETGDPHDPNIEYIELTHTGDRTLNLNQVELTAGVDFIFPSMDLEPGGRTLVVKDIEAFRTRYGQGAPIAGSYTGSLSNSGETITLQDAAGTVIQRFEYTDEGYPITDGGGFSLTVIDPAQTDPNALSDINRWRPSAALGGSPGWDDSGQVQLPGSVVIHELLDNPAPGQSDWIEIHNTTAQSVDISGWYLSDDRDDLMKYRISEGTLVDPCGYIVFDKDRHFGNPEAIGCREPFALSDAGETVYLHSGQDGSLTGYSEGLTFGPSEIGVSMGRYVGSTGEVDCVPLVSPTPGSANSEPAAGPVAISEVLAGPDQVPDAEYVELVNVSDQTMTLYDAQTAEPWRFTAQDKNGLTVDFRFPTDPPVELEPGGCLLLVKSRTMFGVRYTVGPLFRILEWGSGNLADGASEVQLYRPLLDEKEDAVQWICVDTARFEAGSTGKSFQRLRLSGYGNDPVNWRITFPSPGTYTR